MVESFLVAVLVGSDFVVDIEQEDFVEEWWLVWIYMKRTAFQIQRK